MKGFGGGEGLDGFGGGGRVEGVWGLGWGGRMVGVVYKNVATNIFVVLKAFERSCRRWDDRDLKDGVQLRETESSRQQ